MLTFLLSNWKSVVSGVGLLIIAGLYFYNQKISSDLEKAIVQRDMAYEETKKCENGKKITAEVSRDYQSQLSNLNKQLNSVKRMRPSACVPISRSTSGHNGSTGQGEHVGSNAVNSNDLIDYAALAEKYRIQVNKLQDFIEQERK